jgi:hypothetical protein
MSKMLTCHVSSGAAEEITNSFYTMGFAKLMLYDPLSVVQFYRDPYTSRPKAVPRP